VAAPPAALGAVVLAVCLGTPARASLWPDTSVTPPEAALSGDGSALAAAARGGIELNARYPIRRVFLAAGPAEATALEAAVIAGRADMAAFAIELGAAPSDAQVAVLHCLLDRHPSTALADLLTARFGVRHRAPCADADLPR